MIKTIEAEIRLFITDLSQVAGVFFWVGDYLVFFKNGQLILRMTKFKKIWTARNEIQ